MFYAPALYAEVMTAENRGGRPRASSRETLAEAAAELFLEQGFAETSVADITGRAGVSRSSFFNYFSSKADVLWAGFDERVDRVGLALAESSEPETEVVVRRVVAEIAEDFHPDSLALALAQADTMRMRAELERDLAVRRSRIGKSVTDFLSRRGVAALRAEVVGAAYGAAVLAAVVRWAEAGAGRTPLDRMLAEALEAVPVIATGGRVRQLRVVVCAEDFDEAVAFYRDLAGMPERAAYSGEGDARVVILEAGEATLEIANPAQVALIDAVETDGDAPSDSIRIGFEVADGEAATCDLVAGGAELQATARATPWGSLNSRLRAPGGLQLTLFEEGGAGS